MIIENGVVPYDIDHPASASKTTSKTSQVCAQTLKKGKVVTTSTLRAEISLLTRRTAPGRTPEENATTKKALAQTGNTKEPPSKTA